MDIDDENSISTSPEEVSVANSDDDATRVSPVEPTIVPLIALLPTTVPRPLAPLHPRPPVFKPALSQNGETITSDSDSDHDDDPGLKLVRERQEKAMQDLLMKRRSTALAVPTNDMAVWARLRRLGEPITLFGEREMERRDRLRMIMAKLDADGQLEKLMKIYEEEEEEVVASAGMQEEEFIEYPFYTEGSKALRDSRIDIAKYSIKRAVKCLQRARRKMDDPDEDMDVEVDWVLKQAESFVLDCSEFGDERPLSATLNVCF